MNSITYTAITCNKARRLFGACRNLRPYGYTVMMSPAVEHIITSDDVEGIGWVPYNPPKKFIQHWQGWYKYKKDAVARAASLNQSKMDLRQAQGRLDRSNSSVILTP